MVVVGNEEFLWSIYHILRHIVGIQFIQQVIIKHLVLVFSKNSLGTEGSKLKNKTKIPPPYGTDILVFVSDKDKTTIFNA